MTNELNFLLVFYSTLEVGVRACAGLFARACAPFVWCPKTGVSHVFDSRGFGRAVALPRFACLLNHVIGLLAPLFKGGKGGSHRLLLDLPVRTDTNFGGSGVLGVFSDPYRLVRCPVCHAPVNVCVCQPGIGVSPNAH